jgi:hypothetical protein
MQVSILTPKWKLDPGLGPHKRATSNVVGRNMVTDTLVLATQCPISPLGYPGPLCARLEGGKLSWEQVGEVQNLGQQ